jgi:hypothetical protein
MNGLDSKSAGTWYLGGVDSPSRTKAATSKKFAPVLNAPLCSLASRGSGKADV